MPESDATDLTIERLFLIRAFAVLAKSKGLHYPNVEPELIAQFILRYDEYPDVVEQVRPPRLDPFVFNELLEVEREAFISSAASEINADESDLREQVPLLFVTDAEIEEGYVAPSEVVRHRIAKAARRLISKKEELKEKHREVKPSDLAEEKDSKGEIRYFHGGKPFTGTAIERYPPIMGEDALGRGPLMESIEFENGYKHGREVEYKVSTKTERDGIWRTEVSKSWPFNVREYRKGMMISDKYYRKNGKERSKPLLRKWLGL